MHRNSTRTGFEVRAFTVVSLGQTLFRAGRYHLQYKRPLSGGLEQFTGLIFTRATSGRRVLINLRDQLSARYN